MPTMQPAAPTGRTPDILQQTLVTEGCYREKETGGGAGTCPRTEPPCVTPPILNTEKREISESTCGFSAYGLHQW